MSTLFEIVDEFQELYELATDSEVDADRDMTFEADGAMSILSDMTGGKSDAYYYYNEKNNDCLVVIVSKESNRVVDLTYYYDYKKVTENLGSISE